MATTEKKIWDYLKAQGYTDAAVAGVMGNLYAESGLISTNLENYYERRFGMSDIEYTNAVDNGTYSDFITDSAGYGLAQWTYWSRKKGLLEYAKSKGTSIGDLTMQLGYLVQELSSYSILKRSTSVKEVSDYILLNFERPADQSESVKKQRAAYGQEYYDKYTKSNSEEKTEYTASKLLAIARAEAGYKEKASNAYLDNPTANAGSNNWTKFARDLYAAGYYNGNKNGYAWCDVFVDWCFYQLTGKDSAKAQYLECQTGPLGAACAYSADYYRAAGRFYHTPEVGDQIFFGPTGDEEHTGLVENFDSNYVYTIEGNTSNQVAHRAYYLSDSGISGYGRPRYDPEPVIIDDDEEDEDMTQEKFNEMMNKWLELQAEKEASPWSQQAREWAERLGYIQGDEKGRKMYKKPLTREEFVQVLYRTHAK